VDDTDGTSRLHAVRGAGDWGNAVSDLALYALEMSNRPQTLYGIADSRLGLAAWIGWSTPCNAHFGRLARESAWPRADGAAFINVVILGAVLFTRASNSTMFIG
jgi:hypothetical protein